MKLPVTLTLICVLFPEALGLSCYRCTPGMSGTCTDNQTDCPYQCGSATSVVNVAGLQKQVSLKICAVSEECVNGSLNLGLMKVTVNSECCSTDLCNSQSAPALPFGSPNGKQCYTCTGDDCTGTVSCEGDEDHCVRAADTDGRHTKCYRGYEKFMVQQILSFYVRNLPFCPQPRR